MNFKILDKKREKLLSQLVFLKKYGFYLAGGTALALQIGHRASLDFDFYTERKFDNKKLFLELERKFKNVILIQKPEQTLIVKINEVEVSFFHYPYPLIYPLVKYKDVYLASKEDIAAMKLIAISDRGTKRDFIDIYFLLNPVRDYRGLADRQRKQISNGVKEFSLKRIIEFATKKYPNFNIYVGLQGLTYFVDAEKKQQRRLYLFHSISWNKIKKFLIEEVKKYQKNA